MARPYPDGPKEFTFEAGEQRHRVSASDPQYAYEAFSALYRDGDADTFSIVDEATGESVVLMPGKGLVARAKGPDGRTEYFHAGTKNRYTPCAMRFFEDGHTGLDQYARWFADLADLDLPPETRGAARAATFTTEAAVIDEVGRIWGDSGIVDPSDEYYVFFESHAADGDDDDDRAERAELLEFIEFLGLEQVAPPDDALDGEVWVRRDPRLDAGLERWS